jgi:hypothetical protein
MKKKLQWILPLLLLVLFISCKKYPENNLWFSSPERSFKGGKITYFTVDGIDSLELMNSNWGMNVTESKFELMKSSKHNCVASGDFNGALEYMGKSEIKIDLIPAKYGYFSQTQIYNPINSNGISSGRGDGRWYIIKCTRKGVMKIQRTVNSRTYVIQFN